MVKKILLTAAIGLGLGALLVGTEAASYFRTSWGKAKSTVKNSVPVEFQIERARQMIKDIEPEVRNAMQVIVKQEVEVANLQKQISEKETRIGKEKEDLLKLNTDVKSGKESFEYSGRKYTREQVNADLARRFDRYKTAEATLATLKKIHQSRGTSLEGARQKLENMLSLRRDLKVEVEDLEARMQMVAAAETADKYNFSDSEMGRVKELVNDLRTRLDVAERLAQTEGLYRDEIPMNQPTPGDISQQINEHFSGKPAAKTAEAKAKAAPQAVSLAQGGK
jgi:chromosome segregation ATPase